eukprot:NODE_29_length_37665_cov_1.081563.p12 type:complete len:336 gc:universal NODE_29_length_37665_cov_1.081563:24570-23563(-)
MARKKSNGGKLSEIFQKYGTTSDKVMMIVGTLAAIGMGIALPLQSIFMGNIITSFSTYGYTSSHESYFTQVLHFPAAKYEAIKQKALDDLNADVIYVVTALSIVGAVVFVLGYLQEAFWMYTGEVQTRKLRLLYLKSLLYQPVSFHDVRKPGELVTHLVSSISMIQEGISERFPVPIQSVSTFISGFVIGLVKGWDMALVMLSTTPLLAISMAIFGRIMATAADLTQKRYAEAGGLAQEVLANIRIVCAYNSQNYFYSKFVKQIDAAYRLGVSKSLKTALTIGNLMLILFGTYALGFWYGSEKVAEGKLPDGSTKSGSMTGGDVLNVFFAVLIGS